MDIEPRGGDAASFGFVLTSENFVYGSWNKMYVPLWVFPTPNPSLRASLSCHVRIDSIFRRYWKLAYVQTPLKVNTIIFIGCCWCACSFIRMSTDTGWVRCSYTAIQCYNVIRARTHKDTVYVYVINRFCNSTKVMPETDESTYREAVQAIHKPPSPCRRRMCVGIYL